MIPLQNLPERHGVSLSRTGLRRCSAIDPGTTKENMFSHAKGHAAFLVNSAGKIATWNASAEHLFGYAAGDILLSPVTALLPQQAAQQFQQKLQTLSPEGALLATEIRHEDGSNIAANIILAPQYRTAAYRAGERSGGCVVLVAPPSEADASELELVG